MAWEEVAADSRAPERQTHRGSMLSPLVPHEPSQGVLYHASRKHVHVCPPDGLCGQDKGSEV